MSNDMEAQRHAGHYIAFSSGSGITHPRKYCFDCKVWLEPARLLNDEGKRCHPAPAKADPGAVCFKCGCEVVWYVEQSVGHHIGRAMAGYNCEDALRAALAHERDRARRVVRVFWRVRWDDTRMQIDGSARKTIWELAKAADDGGKVYRVTVRRVAKAGKVCG